MGSGHAGVVQPTDCNSSLTVPGSWDLPVTGAMGSGEMFILSLVEATTFFTEACQAESRGQLAACPEGRAVHARPE